MVHSTRSPADTFTGQSGAPVPSATTGKAAPAPAVAGGGDPETISQEMARVGPRTGVLKVPRRVPESWPRRTLGAFPHRAYAASVLSERFQMETSTLLLAPASSDDEPPPPPLAQPERDTPKMRRAVTRFDLLIRMILAAGNGRPDGLIVRCE
jgi:hypothetical protein